MNLFRFFRLSCKVLNAKIPSRKPTKSQNHIGPQILTGQIHSGLLWADCMAGPVAEFQPVESLVLQSHRSYRVPNPWTEAKSQFKHFESGYHSNIMVAKIPLTWWVGMVKTLQSIMGYVQHGPGEIFDLGFCRKFFFGSYSWQVKMGWFWEAGMLGIWPVVAVGLS